MVALFAALPVAMMILVYFSGPRYDDICHVERSDLNLTGAGDFLWGAFQTKTNRSKKRTLLSVQDDGFHIRGLGRLSYRTLLAAFYARFEAEPPTREILATGGQMPKPFKQYFIAPPEPEPSTCSCNHPS